MPVLCYIIIVRNGGKGVIAVTDEQIEFAIFCIEGISERTELPPEKVFDLLTKQSDLLYSYIVPSYDTLHTQGKDYILDDILSVMSQKGVWA